MKSKRLIIILVVIAAFSQACARKLAPQESCNFVQNSDLQRVSLNTNTPLRIYVHQSVPASAYSAIEASVASWNQAIGGKELLKIVGWGVTGADQPRQDGRSFIYWMKTWDQSRPKEQARTTIYWTGDQIYEADIQLNNFHFSFHAALETESISGVDLKSLMIHELGHALGLSHVASLESVMHDKLKSGVARRDLDKTDLDSLRCEY